MERRTWQAKRLAPGRIYWPTDFPSKYHVLIKSTHLVPRQEKSSRQPASTPIILRSIHLLMMDPLLLSQHSTFANRSRLAVLQGI